jgi:hypothetical protein
MNSPEYFFVLEHGMYNSTLSSARNFTCFQRRVDVGSKELELTLRISPTLKEAKNATVQQLQMTCLETQCQSLVASAWLSNFNVDIFATLLALEIFLLEMSRFFAPFNTSFSILSFK